MEMRRQVNCTWILLFAFATLTLYIAQDSLTDRIWSIHRPSIPPIWDERALSGLKLTKTFEYRRQCINSRPNPNYIRTNRCAFKAEGSLLTEPAKLRTKDLANPPNDAALDVLACSQSLTMEIPENTERKSEFRSQELLLGVATLFDRLIVSLPQWAPFLGHTGTPIVVVLRDHRFASANVVQSARELAQALSINLILVGYAEAVPADVNVDLFHSEVKDTMDNFSIAWAFNLFKGPTTKWFVVMDDDTFFPSLPHLTQELNKHDSSTDIWFGATVETGHIKATHAYPFAVGGAGIIISRALMQKVADHFIPSLADLREHGDGTWNRCIRNVTQHMVPFIPLPGLNQMALRGDVSGWYEASPHPLLTLHHWKSFYDFPVPEAHLVSSVAGVDAFLARWVFPDDNLVLTNGYSIVRYNRGIPDLGSMEVTFSGKDWSGYDALSVDLDVLAPMRRPYDDEYPRPRGGPEGKESWVLEHAVREGGTVRQFYVKRGGKRGMDSVIQLDWTRHDEFKGIDDSEL